MIGNEHTGDLSALAEVADFRTRDDNWIIGTLLDYDIGFQMKVFAETSIHGINNGRISKLFVHTRKVWQRDWDTCIINYWDTCIINYDRGWDINPSTPSAKTILNILLTAVDN